MNTSPFLGLVLRQTHISRWSLMRCRTPESLMEHAAIVAIITSLLGEMVAKRAPFDMGKALTLALFHDATEILTSDLPTPVKNATPELRAEFKRIEARAQQRLMGTLPWSSKITDAFDSGSLEALVVKAADDYAAYIKALQETADGNGAEFKQALKATAAKVQEQKLLVPELVEFDAVFGPGTTMALDELLDGQLI